jgi:hypothetical protein
MATPLSLSGQSTVQADDYALREYRVTEQELNRFVKSVD